MTSTDHLIFKVKEGYILLENLEAWYSEGLITPQDRVQIFDGNSKSIDYKIETLIHHYGPEFPFRRIPRDIQEEERVNQLFAETSPPLSVEIEEGDVELDAETSEQNGHAPEFLTSESLSESPRKTDVEAEQSVQQTEDSAGQTHPENPSESPLKTDAEALDLPNPKDFSKNPEDSSMKPDGISETVYKEATTEQQWPVGDQENFQPGYSEQPVCYQQQEYIPLLSVPLGPEIMIPPNELSKVVRSMTLWLQNSGKQHAAGMPVNWTCQFCGIRLISQLEAFNHIISAEHLTRMNFIAPARDLDYWKNWVLEMNSESPVRVQSGGTKSFKQMDVSRIQEFVPQNQAVQTIPTVAVSDPMAFVPEFNPDNSRIPLLDPRISKESYLCRSEFNRILDECEKLSNRQNNYRLTETEKNLSVYCSFCPNPRRLRNKCIIYKHIVSQEHREKIQFRGTWSDLKFWTEFVNEFYRKAGNYNIYNSLELRPRNIPRIPLLDTPAQEKRMALTECKQRHSNLNSWVKAMKKCGTPLPESNPKLHCVCYHCPETPEFSTVWEVLLHVFDGKHFEKIGHSVEKDDFTYFDNLIKRLEFPTVPVATVFPRMATVTLEPEPIEKDTVDPVLEDVHLETTVVQSTEPLEPDTTKKSTVTEEEEPEHTETTVALFEPTVSQEPTVTSDTLDGKLHPETTVPTVVSRERADQGDEGASEPVSEVESQDVEQKSKQSKNKKPKKKGDDKKCCIQ
ncbi:unnamed protein product [Caenorhabditis brenneri]